MQVPYNPVPTEKPTGAGTPSFNVSVSANAFGAQAAEAQESAAKVIGHADAAMYGELSGLGKEIGKVGNEMWDRAVALQQLRNDTEAREAETKYMVEAGKLHAEYGSLQGKAAVDAFPKYQKDLEDVRQHIRGTLTNDDSRRRYDGPSTNLMSRTIFNGAGHAATANKQWQLNTAKSQMDLDAKAVEDDPGNDLVFQDKLNRTRRNVAQVSALQGFEPGSPPEQDLTLKATSALWAQRIIGLSRSAPFEAAKMLDENKTQMTGPDFLKVDQTVRAQGRAVGSKNIANEVYDGSLDEEGNPKKTLRVMEKEAEARAKELNPDDPILAQNAVQALRGKYNQADHAKRIETIANYQKVEEAIAKGVRDESELRADPTVAAAIDALPASKRLAIPAAINRYNASRDKVTNQDNDLRLIGLKNSDVEAYLNTDITSQQLSQERMRYHMEQQQKIRKEPFGDPRVGRALRQIQGAMGSQLEALHIFRRDSGNKDEYDKYVGAVSEAIDVWTQENKKPPTPKDVIDTIGPQVIKQMSEPGKWWGTNEVPFFNQTVPTAFAEKLKADVAALKGRPPDENEIRRAYMRTKFIELYGKKKSEAVGSAPP